MFRTHLKIAWQNARANWSYTTITLASLVLGITLFFFILIWGKRELSYDKHFSSAEPIFRVETELKMQDGSISALPGVGWPIGKILATDYPEVKHVSYLRDWSPMIKFDQSYFFEDALYADTEFFNVFPYELSEGNSATALADPFSLIISKSLKEKYFGTQKNVIGKILMISDTIQYKITGVFKDLSAPSHLKFDMIGSLSSYCSLRPQECEQEYASGWFDVNMYNYIKLKRNASATLTASKIKDIVLEKASDAVGKTGFKPALKLRPVNEVYLFSGMSTGKGTTGNIKTVRLFLMIGVFILILACLNFINLTTAKSVERAKEIGVKKVLGSSKGKLIFQFMTETALLVLTAALISIVLITLLLPYFNQFSGEIFTNDMLFATDNTLLMLSTLILLIPLAGFYPAWILSSFKPISVLKGRFSNTSSGTFLRKGLVITQFVISITFIIGTLAIWKQMNFIATQELGFDKDKILIVEANKVPWGIRHDNARVFKNLLLAQPGINNVTACGAVPGRSGWNSQFAWPEGKPKDAQLIVEYIPVDEEYIKTIGLGLKTGRDFIPGSKVDSTESLIINEAAVRLFGWDASTAVGKKLSTSGKDGRVIGVLTDYHQHGLQQKINPVVLGVADYVRLFAFHYDGMTAKQITAIVEKTWDQVYKGYPLEYRFMDDDFQKQYQKEEKFQQLFGIATIFSIVIACLGLLGLVIYTAQKRVKEIGVRKVLGAGVASITALLIRDFLKLVIFAVLIATPLAWWSINKWLEEFAYRVNIGWSLFLIAGLSSILIAFLTIGFLAIKSAIANPIKSLRVE